VVVNPYDPYNVKYYVEKNHQLKSRQSSVGSRQTENRVIYTYSTYIQLSF